MMFLVKDLHEIGKGVYKTVYQHPEIESQVIKIIRSERVTSDGCFKKHKWWKKHTMQGVYRQFRREIIQYLQLCKNSYGEKRFKFAMETPYALVPTDQGLGLVAEKITGPSGKGETLSKMAVNGKVEEKHIRALQKFFSDCIEQHIVFGEVNAAGILYTESRSGRPEFVLVDGIGEKLLFPIRSISKKNNAAYVRKIEQRIKAEFNINY